MTHAFPGMTMEPLELPAAANSNLRPTLAILTFIAATTVLMLTGAAGQLHALFPAMALIVGVYLYRNYPSVYVSFVLWMWFLSPFVRRVVDYRSYWLDANPILIAPALVTAICAVSLLKDANRYWHSSLLPYLLMASGITMGLVVGIALGQPRDSAATYLLWIAPLCFGYYLQTFSEGPARLRSTLQNAFVGIVALGGLYAIYQFVFAPAWDCYWIEKVSSDAVSFSFGQPNPFELRVWSTLNSPGAFSWVLLVGLLMLFTYTGWAKLPAAVFGYASFLLCMVRTSWFSWVVAILLIAYFNRQRIYTLILPIFALVVVVAFLTQWQPVADKLQQRFATTATVGSDQSVLDREHLYAVLPEYLLRHPLGRGLSNSPVFEGLALDSGILNTPLQLGWLGSLMLLAGLAIQLSRCRLPGSSLTFERVCQFAALALLLQIAGGQVFSGLCGLLFWSLCGTVAGFGRLLSPNANPSPSTALD